MAHKTIKRSYDPPPGCRRCDRLRSFLKENRTAYPNYHNAPVPAIGPEDATLLIVGLAPGLHGANKTGLPFTGDQSGDLLFAMLAQFGFLVKPHDIEGHNAPLLKNCQITNAVRCVPPENRPVAAEVNQCRPFLEKQIKQLTHLKVTLTLGKIAHDSTIRALGLNLRDYPFAHDACYKTQSNLYIISSYHCSRYNINTGKLTVEMFENIFKRVSSLL